MATFQIFYFSCFSFPSFDLLSAVWASHCLYQFVKEEASMDERLRAQVVGPPRLKFKSKSIQEKFYLLQVCFLIFTMNIVYFTSLFEGL